MRGLSSVATLMLGGILFTAFACVVFAYVVFFLLFNTPVCPGAFDTEFVQFAV